MRQPCTGVPQSAAAPQEPATPAPGRGRGRSAAATSHARHKDAAAAAGPCRHQQHSIMEMFGRSSRGTRPKHDTCNTRHDTAEATEAVIDVTSSQEHQQPAPCLRPAVSHVADTSHHSYHRHPSRGIQHASTGKTDSHHLKTSNDCSELPARLIPLPNTPVRTQHAISSPGKRKAVPDTGSSEDDDIVVLLDTPSPAGHAAQPSNGCSTARPHRTGSAEAMCPEALPGVHAAGASSSGIPHGGSWQARDDAHDGARGAQQGGFHGQQAPGFSQPIMSPSKR